MTDQVVAEGDTVEVDALLALVEEGAAPAAAPEAAKAEAPKAETPAAPAETAPAAPVATPASRQLPL